MPDDKIDFLLDSVIGGNVLDHLPDGWLVHWILHFWIDPFLFNALAKEGSKRSDVSQLGGFGAANGEDPSSQNRNGKLRFQVKMLDRGMRKFLVVKDPILHAQLQAMQSVWLGGWIVGSELQPAIGQQSNGFGSDFNGMILR